MKVVIIGGVAGGATAAARIRRLDEKAKITVFEKSGYISYANCGLPYFIGGAITDKNALTLQTPESFNYRFRVDMKVNHEVLSVDPENKNVRVKNLKSGDEFTESYDKLLISTGAKPIKPNINGIESDKIFTVRNVENTFDIKGFISKNKPKSAVVIGGGFVGVEMAENLKELGMGVTLVEAAPQVLAPFDYDMAAFIHSELRQKGIVLALGKAVEGFFDNSENISVFIKGGEKITADMVILAIGVQPDTALAEKAGLALGIKKSILVNEKMETSAPDIYAVGDAVQIKNSVTGEDALISLAGPANKQGRIAADNICGGDSRYKGGQGSSVIKIFGLTAASTGTNERKAKELGLDYEKVILSPMSHAGYYPGGKVMTMKLLFEKESFRILGAQIVGYDGVDKRIDVIATAMAGGITADELAELDLAYAPPYSSAKDPVNMAGFMAENIKTGVVKQWYYEDTESLLNREDITRLDTRTVAEYERGHIEGFVNIPVDELRERLSEIDKAKPVYVICQSGLRSYIATRILTGNSFDAYNFAGGFRFYNTVKTEEKFAESAMPCGADK